MARRNDQAPHGTYERIPQLGRAAIEAALTHGSPAELGIAVLAVCFYETDLAWAESVCIQLTRHAEPIVHGCALLGFGHLARRFHQFTQPETARLLIEAGLRDDDEHVRGQADTALDDVNHFLGWKIQRPYGRA